jgi:hypothetical protein
MRLSIRGLTLAYTLVLSSVLCLAAYAQQPVTVVVSDPHAITLLTAAAAALQGANAASIANVTLSGSARKIAGSDDEYGTAILKAVGMSSSIVLNLPSGSESETRSVTNGEASGTWSGIDGISHPMAFHNLLTEPAWFFPYLAISHGLAPTGYVATYVGHEIRSEVAVDHVAISQTFSAFLSDQGGLQRLSQTDVYLDSVTFLPKAIAFNIHPDNDELVDIPVEVLYANYQIVNGLQVPFHVQKFLNNCLVLDFQFQTVTLNSGVTASQIGMQ